MLDCDEYLVVMNGCVECSINGIIFVFNVVEVLLLCGVVLLGLITLFESESLVQGLKIFLQCLKSFYNCVTYPAIVVSIFRAHCLHYRF